MKQPFNKGVNNTTHWRVGDQVWLSSKNISTSTNKQTSALCMKDVHPVSMFQSYKSTIRTQSQEDENPPPSTQRLSTVRNNRKWIQSSTAGKRTTSSYNLSTGQDSELSTIHGNQGPNLKIVFNSCMILTSDSQSLPHNTTGKRGNK